MRVVQIYKIYQNSKQVPVGSMNVQRSVAHSGIKNQESIICRPTYYNVIMNLQNKELTKHNQSSPDPGP